MHYLKDNTIEMYDIKNKRKFLNRTRLGEMPPCLLIGTKLSIHARQHCIVDYGDDKTRKEHTGLNETSCGIIKHQKYIGKIITNVMNNDLKVTNLKSVKLSSALMGQYGINQNHVVAIEVKGLQSLEKFKEIIMQNGLECIPAENAEQANSLIGQLFGEESTCTTSDGATCCVIKPHAMKQAGTIIDEIIAKYDQLSAIRMISLDRKEAEEFYEVYRDVVAEYAQMVKNFKIISIYNYFTG